jgi:hypothetical protein
MAYINTMDMPLEHQVDYLNWLAEMDGDKEWEWCEWCTGHYNGDAFFDESMVHYNRSFLQFPFKATDSTKSWVPRGHSWYVDQFDHSPAAPPYNSFYTELDVTGMSKDACARMIGTGGCHFNYLTEKHDCLYIWLNRGRSKVEIWGEYSSMQPACSGLNSHRRYINKNELRREDTLDSFLTDILNTHENWSEGLKLVIENSSTELIRMVIGIGGIGLKEIAAKYALSKVVYDPNTLSVKYYGDWASDEGAAYAAMTARFCEMYSSLDSTFAPEYSGGSYDDESYSKYGYHSGW